MNNIYTIFKKDFLEVMRDRRSLIFMLVLPSLVVPLLVLTINYLTRGNIENLTSGKTIIGLIGVENLPEDTRKILLTDAKPVYLDTVEDLSGLHPLSQGLLYWSEKSDPGILFEGKQYYPPVQAPELYTKFSFVDRSDRWNSIIHSLELYGYAFLQDQIDNDDHTVLGISFMEAIKQVRETIESNKMHAVVFFPPDFTEALEQGRNVRVCILADAQKFRSSSGASRLVRLLRFALNFNSFYKLEEQSLDTGLLSPLRIEQFSINPAESLYLRLLPYFMVLMCFIGGLYPAIDLVAGEKERNTLETILICPVSRFEILMGKLLVICLCGFIASLLTFFSLSLTLITGMAGDELLFRDILYPEAVLNYLLMLIPLAALFAALLLTLSTVARNFKEAQSYIMPFNFLILIPAFYALLPGVELDAEHALIPVLNVTLALRDIWSGDIGFNIVTLIIASSTAYSLLMVALCVWLFQKESILFRN